jgi:hypothetical protein
MHPHSKFPTFPLPESCPFFRLAMTLALAAAVCLLCLRTAVAQVSCDESAQYMHAVVSAVGAHACVFGVAFFSRSSSPFALNPWSFKCGEPPRTRTSASPLAARATVSCMCMYAVSQARMIGDGNLPSAMQLSQESVARHPHCVESYMSRGATLFTVGRLEEAIYYFEQVVCARPAASRACGVEGGGGGGALTFGLHCTRTRL